MTRIALLAAIALAALAPPAGAKEIDRAVVCGSSGCVTVRGESAEQLAMLDDRAAEASAPGAAPFFRLRMYVDAADGGGEDFAFGHVYMPSTGMLRTGNRADGFRWIDLSPESIARYDRAVRRLEPFRASSLGGLDFRLPDAQVSETVLPPRPAGAAGGGRGGLPWPAIALGLLLAAALLGYPKLGHPNGSRLSADHKI